MNDTTQPEVKLTSVQYARSVVLEFLDSDEMGIEVFKYEDYTAGILSVALKYVIAETEENIRVYRQEGSDDLYLLHFDRITALIG